MNKSFRISLAFALALSAPSIVLASGVPTHIGQCVKTKIKWIGTRLGTPGSGSAVKFTNGGYQVSYSTVPAIVHSKVGDRVQMSRKRAQSITAGRPSRQEIQDHQSAHP